MKVLNNGGWNKKRGVALVTVLLMMMVATIATTAIYKWLSRMGDSSSAELKRSEAYQASVAGIETVRAWLEHNADDAGALLTEYYFENPMNGNNNRVPILMDSVLQNFPSANQKKFSAYLVNADVQSYPYKLKVLVTGTSRDGSKYSQVAVMNVNGLYRDSIPSKAKSAPFNEGLYGSLDDQISLNVNSAIINGNAKFNTTVNVEDYLIVTGTLNMNSNSTVGTLYVKGSLQTCTNLHVKKNAYVEDRFVVNGKNDFDGDLYVQNGIDFTGEDKLPGYQCNTGSGGYFTVKGNLSTYGNVILPRHTTAYPIKVDGNTIVGDDYKVIFPQQSSGKTYINQPFMMYLNGHVFLSGGFNEGSHVYYKNADKIKLGASQEDTVYIKPGTLGSDMYRVSEADGKLSSYMHWSNHGISTPVGGQVVAENKYGGTTTLADSLKPNTYCNKQNCAPITAYGDMFRDNADFFTVNSSGAYEVNRNEIFVQINGKYVSSNTSIDSTEWIADAMSEYSERITNEYSDGCDTTNHVQDPIQFDTTIANVQKNPKLHTANHRMHCTGIWDNWNSNWKKINDCYDSAQKYGELYKNEWLTLAVDNPQWAADSKEILEGKFIIIVNGTGAHQIDLPKTKDSLSMVFMYFPDGYNYSITTAGNSDNSGYPSNYFLYSEKNLKNLQFGSRTLNGSVYLRDCHKAGADQEVKIRYNQKLMQELANAGVVCENDGTNQCSEVVAGSSSSAAGGDADDFRGRYENLFVPTSPRLKVNVESAYKSDEKIGTFMNVHPSVVVMPRVIRLPVGNDLSHLTLADFYQPRVLNDSARNIVRTVAGSSVCAVGVPGTGPLINLTKGVFKCTFTPSNPSDKTKYGISRFYVVADEAYATPSSASNVVLSSAALSSPSSASSSSVESSTSEPVSSSSSFSASCFWKMQDENDAPTSQVVKPGEVVTYDIDLKGTSGSNVTLVRDLYEEIDRWYLVDTTSTISFEAPRSDGTYEYVLLGNDSRVLCRDTLIVAGNAPEVCTEKCGCTCGSSCQNLQYGDNVGLYNDRNKTDLCLFGTSVTGLKAHACGDEIEINGVKVDQKKSCTSEAACASLLSNIPKIDGGYYMKLPGDNHRKTGTVAGATTNPCKCGSCGCTCSDCKNIITGDRVGLNNAAAGTTMCFFGTSIDQLKLDGPCATDIYVNGQKLHYDKSKLTCNSQSGCESVLGSLSSVNRHYQNIGKIDGGYYVEIPKSNHERTVLVSGATENPCSEGCGCTCEEGCDNIIVGDNVGQINNRTGAAMCLFGTSIVEYDYDNTCAKKVTINGSVISSNKTECHGVDDCASTSPFKDIPKYNGGYYMYLPANSTRENTAMVTGATSRPSQCSGSGCSCTCSDCRNVIVGNNVGVDNDTNKTTKCVFGTSITAFDYGKRDGGDERIIVNGILLNTDNTSKAARKCSGATECASKFSDIHKINGGYYVEIPKVFAKTDISTVLVTGASSNPCKPVDLTTTFISYTKGSTSVKTGTVGNGKENMFRCTVTKTTAGDRAIGKIGDCEIKIFGHNDKSWDNSGYNHCELSSNTTYTFTVYDNPPKDLTCGLSW